MDEGSVWLYWENQPGSVLPNWLHACLRSIYQQAGSLPVRVLGRDDIFQWLPELSPETWYGLPSPVFRSDYARARLLLKYGGIWLDLDTIALSPLERLLDEVDRHRFVAWGTDVEGRCYNNVMVAKPGADFLLEWTREQDRAIASARHEGKLLSYSSLGQDIARELGRQIPWKSLPRSRVAPIIYDRWRAFFSPYLSPGRLLRQSPYVIVLWNAVMGEHLVPYTESQLYRSPILLGRLLRLGTNQTTLAREEADRRVQLDLLPRLRYSDSGVRVEVRARRAWSKVIGGPARELDRTPHS